MLQCAGLELHQIALQLKQVSEQPLMHGLQPLQLHTQLRLRVDLPLPALGCGQPVVLTSAVPLLDFGKLAAVFLSLQALQRFGVARVKLGCVVALALALLDFVVGR